MESPIRDAYDLSKQYDIKYGCVKKGATWQFFQVNNSRGNKQWYDQNLSNSRGRNVTHDLKEPAWLRY